MIIRYSLGQAETAYPNEILIRDEVTHIIIRQETRYGKLPPPHLAANHKYTDISILR